MSTISLPSYLAEPALASPLYTEEPQTFEQRIALTNRLRARPRGDFVKHSKSGGLSLRLIAQEDNIALPAYGLGDAVEGTVDLSKTDGVTSVEVKIEGRLRLKEIAEGGTTSTKLCLDAALLWVKDGSNSASKCPSSLSFCLILPTTFSFEGDNYPLPPTHEVHLSGLPGFHAAIDYSVTATANKGSSVPTLGPLVKSSIFGISIGNPSVSTPFLYAPRTRPAFPIPQPLKISQNGLTETPEWKIFQSSMRSRTNAPSIDSKLYLPSSRIFCIGQPIPFYLVLESSPESLAIVMAFGPSTGTPTKRASRIKVMRQSAVDVRNALILGTKTDIWRIDCIGDGSFKRIGDGPNFIAFSGEIVVDSNIKIGGFKAAGLTVKDWILLSITPPESATKAPFTELRQCIPIRLTTDQWIADGTGIGADTRTSEYSVPSSPEDSEAESNLASLGYAQ